MVESRLSSNTRGPLLRYGASTIAVLVAVLLRQLIDPLIGDATPFATMFGAVAFSVWFGGRRVAAYAAVAGYFASDWLFVPGHQPFRALYELPAFASMLAYALSCGVIVALGRGLQTARRKFEIGEQELFAANRLATERADELQALFDAAPIAVWVAHDASCRQVTANRFATGLVGGTREWAIMEQSGFSEASGFRLQRAGRDLELAEQPLQRAAGGEAVHGEELDLILDSPGGSFDVVHLSCHAVPLVDEHGAIRGALAVATDITPRKRSEALARRAEESLRRSERAQRLLVSLNDATRPLHDPADVLNEVLHRTGEFFGVAQCTFVAVDSGGSFVAVEGDPERTGSGLHHRVDFSATMIDELAAGHPVVVTDASTDPRVIALPGKVDDVATADRRAGAMLCVPLVKGGRLAGVLTIAQPATRAWTLDDAWLLGQVAERTWATMENARAEQALRESRDVLREADRRKDEFLAVLAHELRNPLAPIRNASEFLRVRGRADVELQGAREIIDRQVQHLVRLVDDLLDVSRISRGKINLQRDRVALGVIVGSAVEASRPVLESLDHRLEVSLPEFPVYLDADLTRLSQVLTNLLNNSAKYTPPGGRIVLSAASDGAQLIIRVQDNGIGIPADMLRKIFQMFTQVEQSLERAAGGLGIGLTLVERLVEMHGGHISAHSDGPGRGSEFVVTLPLHPVMRESTTPVASVAIATPASLDRILVVDDNVDSADSLAMMLRLIGHEVHTAYDGEAALRLAANVLPGVLLLDIGLPLRNGYEVARAVRAEAWGRELLIVAISGWGQDEDRRRSREAGFDHHLVKPVDHPTLLSLLHDRRAAEG